MLHTKPRRCLAPQFRHPGLTPIEDRAERLAEQMNTLLTCVNRDRQALRARVRSVLKGRD